MKKVFAFAMMLAAAVAGATGYEDWFKPPKGWSGYAVPVHIQFGSAGGKDFDFPVTADLGDIIDVLNAGAEDVPQTAKNAYIISLSALANSIYAACQAQMNKIKIDNIGASLEGVFVAAYGQRVDERGNVMSASRSGVDTAQLRQQLLANKNAIVAGGQAAGGSKDNPLTIVETQSSHDGKQFVQHVDTANKRSLTSLRGWYGLSDDDTSELDGADGWAFAGAHYFIPCSFGMSRNLGWLKWNGCEETCFSVAEDGIEESENNLPLHLKYWYGGDGGCGESLQNLLTNKAETITTDRRKHYFLARYGENDALVHDLHWVKMDESPLETKEPDDHSIEHTPDADTGSQTDAPKKLRLKGFDTAKPALEKDGAVLPYVDATSDDLQWGGIETFFANSVFRKSETTGKILLNGTSEEGKVKVLTMTGNGGDDQQISSLAFDNASIDGNQNSGGVVRLHAFDTAPSPYAGGVSFADALTNTATQISGMSIPVRFPSAGGATVGYVPMGKITGIPAAAVDGKTIEINETDPQNKFLQLHGAAGEGIALAEGDVYQIGSDGKGKFAKVGGDSDDAYVATTNASIESYTGEDGGRYFRLRGWTDSREDDPHILGWNGGTLKYWLVDGVTGIDYTDEDGLTLSGYPNAANGAIPYAMKSGVGGLGWLNGVDGRVPLLHANGAPTTMAIGASLDTANVSAVPTLNVANFTSGGNCSVSLNKLLSDPGESANRSTHQFMARFTGNGAPTVHWVGIDDIIAGGGGGAPVDDASITTNTTHGAVTSGNASIYGFASASTGTVPRKKNGILEWWDAERACTNKWESLLYWMGLPEWTQTDEGINFDPSDYGYGSIGDLLNEQYGFVYSSHGGTYFNNPAGMPTTASFTAPTNWADGVSIGTTQSGTYQLKGFSDAPNLAVPQKSGDSLTWQTNVTASVKIAVANNIVTTSVEWLGSAGSDGNGANAYSIRIQRGRLAVNANGEIYVAQDDNLTQYIRTTPHSAETGN